VKSRHILAALLGVAVVLLYNHGPEFIRYNPYRVYKEIIELKQRVAVLEAK